MLYPEDAGDKSAAAPLSKEECTDDDDGGVSTDDENVRFLDQLLGHVEETEVSKAGTDETAEAAKQDASAASEAKAKANHNQFRSC